jgi:hypothetical protein
MSAILITDPLTFWKPQYDRSERLRKFGKLSMSELSFAELFEQSLQEDKFQTGSSIKKPFWLTPV